MSTAKVSGKSKSVSLKIVGTMLALMFVVILGSGLLSIDVSQATKGHRHKAWKTPKYCSETASAAYIACQNEVEDDYWIAVGNCINVSDADERKECKNEAWAQRKGEDGKELCKEQREARLEVCEDLGQGRYDPVLDDPGNYLEPAAIKAETANRYFPLVPGTTWVYKAFDEDDNLKEQITVKVTDKIKTIEYPEGSGKRYNCTVVNDVVEEYDSVEDEYAVIEDTDDWYIQHKDTGDVLYMGEISRNYEDGELVDLEGSWQAGREFAKPGILMYGNPNPDDEEQQNPYRQEFALGDAEDIGEVVSRNEEHIEVLNGTFTNDLLQTKDFTPIEPNVFEYKYYAPGIGLILEVGYEDDAPTGERVELVNVTP